MWSDQYVTEVWSLYFKLQKKYKIQIEFISRRNLREQNKIS